MQVLIFLHIAISVVYMAYLNVLKNLLFDVIHFRFTEIWAGEDWKCGLWNMIRFPSQDLSELPW